MKLKLNQMEPEREGDIILFREKEHQDFYRESLKKCKRKDSYHKALVYCLGIDRDTRDHAGRIFDFSADGIRPVCLYDDWQTSGSMKIIRLAFNLYCDSIPTVAQMEVPQDLMKECREYAPGNLFGCAYAPYFWQAIRIRFPEYCGFMTAVSAGQEG